MYILQCNDGSYYTGSTKDLELRLEQHMEGKGANHTRKRLPVKLLYFEEYQRIDEAYYREKQVQGWNRKKKEALIDGKPELLPDLAIAYRDRNAPKPQSRPEAPQSRPEAPQSRPEEAPESGRRVLEGQLYEAEFSSEPATPFGFESPSTKLGNHLSRREALDLVPSGPDPQHDAPQSRPDEPQSRPEVTQTRPEDLEGQTHEAEFSSEPATPFGFESPSTKLGNHLSQRGSLSQREALESRSMKPRWRPEEAPEPGRRVLEGQPHDAEISSKPEPPYGFESPSTKLGNHLSRRGSLHTGLNEPQSRPEGLEGQHYEAEFSSEPAPPFGFESPSTKLGNHLSRRGDLGGQPHEAKPSRDKQSSNKSKNK